MKRMLAWFQARLGLGEVLGPMMAHPIPRGAAGPMGWFYVFGSASMTLFFLQILTGICLALMYVPSAAEAYDSLVYLNTDPGVGNVAWGGVLRAIHYYAASAMVVMVLIHMTQVFLHGSYKYPRELTWVLGVFLLLLTLGLAFTGQIMRWDADAYWGVGVGASMAGRVPYVGPYVVHLLLGGPTIGGDTLSRFFALHVFVLPGLLILVLALHLWLVLHKGVSAPPVPGQLVDPATYDATYEDELKRGVPFLGEAVIKDAFFSAVVVIAVVCLAVWLGPKGPSGFPDGALRSANPRPDWPFLWLFAVLSLCPPEWETFVILTLPVALIVALLAVPFISNKGERAPSRRPVAVLMVIVIYAALGVLTYLGATAPWSPKMSAWSGDPVPERIVKKATTLELQGALVLQNKNCRNCHALDGVGGTRGPDLTYVGVRQTYDQLCRQVLQGGGNMPAYGKQLRPEEVTALVEFLVSLRPPGEARAREPVTPK